MHVEVEARDRTSVRHTGHSMTMMGVKGRYFHIVWRIISEGGSWCIISLHDAISCAIPVTASFMMIEDKAQEV